MDPANGDKARTKPQQIDGYRRLASHLDDYRHAVVIGYDPAAADRFDQLRRDYPRLGTLDLKIAAVALANDALLVSPAVAIKNVTFLA